MKIGRDNVLTQFLTHYGYSVTISSDDDDDEEEWSPFNCTSTLRLYFPPFPGISINPFFCIYAIIKNI